MTECCWGFFSQEALEPEQPNISKDGSTDCSEAEMGRGEDLSVTFIHWALLAWMSVFVGGPKRERPPFITKALVFGVCDWCEIRATYKHLHLNICPQTAA